MTKRTIYRHLLLLAALPALMLAACSRDELAGTTDNGPEDADAAEIRFEIGFAPTTPAATAAADVSAAKNPEGLDEVNLPPQSTEQEMAGQARHDRAGAPSTRVTTSADGEFKCAWEDGDAIGIYAVVHGEPLAAAGNPIHNVKMTYSTAGGAMWSGRAYWPAASDGRTLDFYAYYPYDPSFTDPTQPLAFSVKTDQNAVTGGRSHFSLSDLLAARADNSGTGYARGTTVALSFGHLLAMVQVTLDNTEGGIDPNEIAVSLLGVKSGATLNLAAAGAPAAIADGSGDDVTVKMYRVQQQENYYDYSARYTFRALVPAQNLAARQSIFRITNGDLMLRSSELTSQLTMTAGKAETFKQKIPRYVHRVSIPAGTFQMGSPDSDNNANNNEKPQHQVTLSAFHIGKYEITRAQYTDFLNTAGVGNNAVYGVNGYGSMVLFDLRLAPLNWNNDKSRWEFTGDGETPMSNVNWYGAKAYAEWAGGSLPTEAQWEYACRAGSTTIFSFGDDASELGDYAWYITNAYSALQPVGGKRPNLWGLYDMHGNADEWCSDRYGWYAPDAVSDPVGPSVGDKRIVRGGRFDVGFSFLRSAYRKMWEPDNTGMTGFRIVFPEPVLTTDIQ